MIQLIGDFLQEIVLRHSSDAMMAWVQYIPAALSLVSAGAGAISQGRKNREMKGMVKGWEAENKAMFNNDYYKNYTQTEEAQNMFKQARDLFDRQAKRDANTAVITGATVEGQAAAKEARNRVLSNLIATIGAQGTRYKERAKDRYLNRKSQIQGMQYNQLAQDAESAGNLMYNGLAGLAGTNWAGILGGGAKLPGKISQNPVQGIASANPVKDVNGIIPKMWV